MFFLQSKEAKKITDAGGGPQTTPSKPVPSSSKPILSTSQEPTIEEPPYVSLDKTPELKPKSKDSTSPFLSAASVGVEVTPPSVDRSSKPVTSQTPVSKSVEKEKNKNKDQVRGHS